MNARELMLQLGLVDPDTPVKVLVDTVAKDVVGIERTHILGKTVRVVLTTYDLGVLPEIDDMGRVKTTILTGVNDEDV